MVCCSLLVQQSLTFERVSREHSDFSLCVLVYGPCSVFLIFGVGRAISRIVCYLQMSAYVSVVVCGVALDVYVVRFVISVNFQSIH